MSTMTLEPCPFCGSSARRGEHDVPAVQCSNEACGASLHRYHREEAYVLWNRRPHLAQPAQAVDVRLHSGRAEDVAQWLYANGHHGAAFTVRQQLDVRNERIRALESALSVQKGGPVVDGVEP